MSTEHDPWAHESLFVGLNDEQAMAVKTTDGPLLILAGAGSGKTKTLTHRIAYVIQQGLAAPHNILAVTFTNKAAREMRERVWVLIGDHAGEPPRTFMPFMGTFHSVCVRLLRQDGTQLGIDPRFVILDESDRMAVIKRLMVRESINEKQFSARTISGRISAAKNELMDPIEYATLAADPLQKIVARLYPQYERELQHSSSLDFDDLIGRTVELLSSHEAVRQRWQEQFRYIMIDEYQDTNAAQYKLVKLLTNTRNNICVVGDDWQSIYSWRGADFRNILNFERDYASAVVVKLEQNYRSTESILGAAHSVISKNEKRSEKKLWTLEGKGRPVSVMQVANERGEAEAVARAIIQSTEMRRRNYRDYAVLYRTNAQSRSLEDAFMRLGLPYRIYGGLRFYDRKEIKDILAYLRFIYQPNDSVSFERIANVPARSLGDVSLARFRLWQENQRYSLSEALTNVDQCTDMTPKARTGLKDVADIVSSFREQMEHLAVAEILELLITRLQFYRYLDDGSIQGESRVENVKELISVAKGYSGNSLADFLEEAALVSDTDSQSRSDNAVTLMTLHSAKGLEFPVVYIVGMEEGIFPHSRAHFDPSELEEERRLAYVGMTRAKQELVLVYASSRVLFGQVQYNPPSQFLKDIGGESTEGTAGEDSVQCEATTDEPRYVPDLEVGDGVQHAVFGKGQIMEIEGDVAAIYFEQRGMKKLNIAFAPLKKL